MFAKAQWKRKQSSANSSPHQTNLYFHPSIYTMPHLFLLSLNGIAAFPMYQQLQRLLLRVSSFRIVFLFVVVFILFQSLSCQKMQMPCMVMPPRPVHHSMKPSLLLHLCTRFVERSVGSGDVVNPRRNVSTICLRDGRRKYPFPGDTHPRYCC